MKKILIVASLLAVVASAGASISLSFNPESTVTVTGSEIVGLNGVQADNWVNINTNAATSLDIDGGGGSATLSFVSAYNFEATPDASGFQDGSQNAAMMTRAIRVGGPGDATITISGLGTNYTDNGYTVFVYFGTDNHTRTHRFSVGGTTVSGTEQAPATWQGSFIQTTADAEVGNFMVAKDLTASSFTITDTGTSPGKGGIAGIEIVASGLITVFSSDKPVVYPGETVTLSWDAADADTLSIDQGVGNVTGLTSKQVVVTADTLYTLSATDVNGAETKSTMVSVISTPPVIESFTTSATKVLPGSEVTLSWETTDATGIEIDQGIGDVTGITFTQVVINAETTYTLTVININGSVTDSVTIRLDDSEDLFSSAFDGNTGAASVSAGGDNVSGSPTLGITDWVVDSDAVSAISDLNVISPERGFVTISGSTYATTDNIFINHNLNIADRAGPRGFSLTFTLDLPKPLSQLKVRSGHSNNTGNTDQTYSSDLTYSLSGGTLSAAVTGTSTEDYAIAPDYHEVAFDLEGTTLGIGTYTLEVTMNNLVGGGAYAIFDGISLSALEGLKTAATISISGPVSSGTEMEISWLSEAGSFYTVETNSSLIDSAGWAAFSSGVIGTGGDVIVTNSIGPDQTFYRVITE